MLATAGHKAPYWVCAVYLVLLAIVGIAAALFMDNLDHGIEVNHMRSILAERDTYVISLLYICTFGSWIGFAFAFGQLMHVNFLASGESVKHVSLHAAQIACVRPQLGSLARIYGGRLADRMGGSRVTLGVLGGMILGAGLLVTISTFDYHGAGTGSVAMIGYVVGFMVLFILSGMIGFCAAVGALGGVGINLALRESYLSSGTDVGVLGIFGLLRRRRAPDLEDACSSAGLGSGRAGSKIESEPARG